MTQQDKDLLLRDLCARLPYGVVVKHPYGFGKLESITKEGSEYDLTFDTHDDNYYKLDKSIKPYLRPMSSMTEEERNKATSLFGHNKCINEYGDVHCYNNGESVVDLCDINSYYDWLNSHHFDYRGLIGKRLALEAPEGMYNLK